MDKIPKTARVLLATLLAMLVAIGVAAGTGSFNSLALSLNQRGDVCANLSFTSVDEMAQAKILCGESLSEEEGDSQSGATAQSGEEAQSGDQPQSGDNSQSGEETQSGDNSQFPGNEALNTAWYTYEGKDPSVPTYDPNTTLGLYTFGPWKAIKPSLGQMAMADMNVDQAKEELRFVTGTDADGGNTIDIMQVANLLVALDSTTTADNLNDRANAKLNELAGADQEGLKAAVNELKTMLDNSSYEIAQLPAGSYMTQGAIGTTDRGKPTLHFGEVYRGETITVLRVTTKDGGTRDLRLACHFQLYFGKAQAAPAPTMPETRPGVTRDNELTPEPEPPTTPTPTPTPPTPEPPAPTPPTPTPEPKDPSEDPAQNGNAGNGGGQNEDSGPGEYIPPDEMEQPPEEDYTAPPQPEPEPTKPAPGADTGGSGTTPGGGDDATTEDGTDAGQPAQGGDADPDD